MRLMWYTALLTRGGFRIWGTALGVAISVALLTALAAFLDHSSATMTERATSAVPIDWQVQLVASADPAGISGDIRNAAKVTALHRVEYADTTGFQARTGGTVQTTGPGKAIAFDAGYAKDFSKEVRPLVGGASGALLAQQTAANLHARPGDTVSVERVGLAPVDVKIDGVVELPDADALFQGVGLPPSASPRAPPDNVLILPSADWHRIFDPQTKARPGSTSLQFHVRIDHDNLPAAPTAAYTAVTGSTHNLEARVAGKALVSDNLGSRLSAVREDALYARVLSDVAGYLRADPARIKACSERIRVLKVNARTLTMFEAVDLAELVANLGNVFRDDMLGRHVEELTALWNGQTEFSSQSINYSLSGRRIDIQMTGRVLPGYEQSLELVLVAIEDVTERETARRNQVSSKNYARGLFEHSPVSLWVEDFSSIKKLLDEIRQLGIEDLRVFTDVHPEFVQRCMSEIRVLDVNRQTLELFQAPDESTLLCRLGEIFRDEMERSFREQLIDLWDGRLFQRREVVNYDLNGKEIHVLLQFSVLPGHEDDWALVQVALTDITARKKAEAYLEFLGTHDVLTKLYNRAFYTDELNRLERKELNQVTIIVVDLNGLKAANDRWGHAIGDALLRRAGEVLGEAVDKPSCAARIGGDEFALLLPGVDAEGGKAVMEEIRRLVDVNNQFYPGVLLSLSMGAATGGSGERLEEVVRRADLVMYVAKRNFYSDLSDDLHRGDILAVQAATK